MIIDVVPIAGDGSIRRAIADTAGRADAARWRPSSSSPSRGTVTAPLPPGHHARRYLAETPLDPQSWSAHPRRSAPPVAFW